MLPGEAYLRQNVPGFAIIDPPEPIKLPIEARDGSIYVGFLATWLYLSALGRGRAKGLPPPWILVTLVTFVFIMGADGFNALLYDLQFYRGWENIPFLYEPRLELRLATGLLCGIAFGGILVPVINYSLWRDDDARPVFENWKQFLGGLAVLAIIFLMNVSEIGIFYYPLAIFSAASVIILLAFINAVFALSFFKNMATAHRWRDLVNPFAFGVLLALTELGALSAMRYAVLGTATLP